MLNVFLTLILAFSEPALGLTARDLIVSEDADLRPPMHVAREQVRSDLEHLIWVARKAYAGPDLTKILQSVDTNDTSTTPRAFCELLAKAFRQVRDQHLRASVGGLSCGEALPLGRVGDNVERERIWSLRDVDGVPVLAISRFAAAGDTGWGGFLEVARQLKAAARPFVLDLRGNRGGDDGMGFELARVLYDLDEYSDLPLPVEARLHRQTPEAFALEANRTTLAILRLRAQGRAVPQHMERSRRESLQWLDHAQRGLLPEVYREDLSWPVVDTRRFFAAPIYVLVDRACASACETTLQALEALPSRVLVGEHSAGAVTYGNMGRLVLPHSKVQISLAAFSVRFRDFRRVEGAGYAPQIAVAEGEDALVSALHAARDSN